MKTTASPRLILLAASVCCALAAPRFALAQPQAPIDATAPTDAATPKEKHGHKPKGEKKSRDKKLSPRVVSATETAMGKALTPDQTAQLTKALQIREAAVKAANDAYYAAFAQTTGLTTEQIKEIDKPARGGARPIADAKAEGKTNMDAPTETEKGAPAPVTP